LMSRQRKAGKREHDVAAPGIRHFDRDGQPQILGVAKWGNGPGSRAFAASRAVHAA
jgi:hypothetical protein